MNKLTVFIILLFLVAVALLSVYNLDMTTLKVPFYQVYEVPKIGLILFSAITGAFFTFILFALRDTRRFITGYKLQKRQKKEERIAGLYSKAISGLLAHDLEEAKPPLEEILQEEPEHVNSLLRLGDIASQSDNHEKAVEYYKKALGAQPSSIEALLSIESEMQALGRPENALNYVEEILEIDPDNLTALERKRAALEKLEHWADAMDVQKSIIKHPHLLNQKAEGQRLTGYKYEFARQSLEMGEMDRAGKLFRSALRYDKDFVPAYLGAAEVLIRQEETEEALEFLKKGFEATGSAVVLARLEDMLIGIGDPEEIIRLYRSELVKKPDDPVLKFLLGKLYYRLEMVDDAFDALRGLETCDQYPVCYSLLGELHMRRENYEKAAKNFRKAMEIKPWRLFYCCKTCGNFASEWAGRCPDCGSWSTYTFNIYGKCKI